MPSALQVLALPLLQMTARARPFSRCFFVTSRGAPLTRFVVYTAAAEAGTELRMSARSRFVRFLRTPQWMPAPVKPCAAQTPPSMSFISVI